MAIDKVETDEETGDGDEITLQKKNPKNPTAQCPQNLESNDWFGDFL